MSATARIRNVWMKFREPLPFLTSRAPPLEMKGRVYTRCVRSSMTYGNETMPLLVDVGLKFERAEMQMIRWMCGITMKDRRTNEELRRMIGFEHLTTVIRSGRLRWYGQMMRKCIMPGPVSILTKVQTSTYNAITVRMSHSSTPNFLKAHLTTSIGQTPSPNPQKHTTASSSNENAVFLRYSREHNDNAILEIIFLFSSQTHLWGISGYNI